MSKRTGDHSCVHHATLPSTLTRREMLGVGLGAVAGMFALPTALIAASDSGFQARTTDVFGAGTRPDIDIAVRAARWIRTARIETPNGISWPADPVQPASVGTDLYNGTPGVVLFHLEQTTPLDARLWIVPLIASLLLVLACRRMMRTAKEQASTALASEAMHGQQCKRWFHNHPYA